MSGKQQELHTAAHIFPTYMATTNIQCTSLLFMSAGHQLNGQLFS